jgi:RND family efflux transporter MFP subunit
MKKLIVWSLISLMMGFGAAWWLFRTAPNVDNGTERKVLYYRDPMNPQSTSPVPKKAPDGMDFVPVYADEESSDGGKKILYYHDPMHPWYTSDKPGKAPDCGMDLVPVYEVSGGEGIKIDPIVIQNIGVRTEPVRSRSLTRSIRTVGKIEYDETKVFTVNTKVMGWIEQLHVDYTGRRVKRGEPLFELYSPELLNAQQEYLQALHYQRQMKASSFGDIQNSANELLASSRRKLMYWDIPVSDIRALEERGELKKTMTIYSPYDGIVMEKMAFKGQNIMPGMELFRIVDLSTVWIQAEVYQDDVPWIQVGQGAEVEVSYLPGKKFSGLVSFIYPMLSMETRTVKVRVEARNTASLDLKPEMFVNVAIKSPVRVESVAVPDQAVIRSGYRNVVIVSKGGGYFDPREVKLGVSADGYIQVLEGLHDGERIVVSAQFLIDSESNLKAAIAQMSGPAAGDSTKNKSLHEESHGSGKHAIDSTMTMKSGSGKTLYTCPMHPEVVSDKPGDCPKCGMHLVPKE